MEKGEFQSEVEHLGQVEGIIQSKLEKLHREKAPLREEVVQDAKEQSYSYVEGYPFADRKFEYQYHGPIPLYEKHGFRMVAQKEWFCIMQKKL